MARGGFGPESMAIIALIALGFLYLLLSSVQGTGPLQRVQPVVSSADDDATHTDDVESMAGSTACSAANLMGHKGSKKSKAKPKSKWGRGSSGKWRSGGKHQ